MLRYCDQYLLNETLRFECQTTLLDVNFSRLAAKASAVHVFIQCFKRRLSSLNIAPRIALKFKYGANVYFQRICNCVGQMKWRIPPEECHASDGVRTRSCQSLIAAAIVAETLPSIKYWLVCIPCNQRTIVCTALWHSHYFYRFPSAFHPSTSIKPQISIICLLRIPTGVKRSCEALSGSSCYL